MRSFRPPLFLRCVLIALPLALTACENLDWFDEKKTPLAGERKPIFPTGVPGVNYNAPPLQPTNSNIPIDTQISVTGQTQQGAQPGEYDKDQPAAAHAKNRTARNAPQNQPSPPSPPPPRSVAQPAAANDPWSDTRTPN
jgi:hypothetical protein